MVLFQAEPEEVEGPVRAPLADRVPGAGPGGEVELLRKRTLRIGDPDEDKPDGFLLCPASGPAIPVTESRNRRRPCARPRPSRAPQALRRRRVHNHGVRHPEQAFFGLVGVGNESPPKNAEVGMSVRRLARAARAALCEARVAPRSRSRRPPHLRGSRRPRRSSSRRRAMTSFSTGAIFSCASLSVAALVVFRVAPCPGQQWGDGGVGGVE